MDGFTTTTGRVIFSLAFEIESLAGSSGPSQLIAPLDAHGNGRYARPADRCKRLIDVGTGDWIKHRGRPLRVLGRSVYRSSARSTGPLYPGQ